MTIVIIGAGIAGIIAARRLRKQGLEVIVLEKSRGYGGRMATRRIGEAVVDHGAQFYAVHAMFFRMLTEKLQDKSIVDGWCRGFLNGDRQLTLDGYLRYHARGGMSHMAKYLALEHGEALDVRLQHKVTTLTQHDSHWQITCDNETEFKADAVIVTAPVPQALQLLKKAHNFTLDAKLTERLSDIKYDPCIAAMAVLDGPSGIPEPGAIANVDPMSPIRWIADNQQKGVSPVPAVTIHGTPHFSRKHWKIDRLEAAQLLLEAAQPYLKAECVELQAHGWRFSEPKTLWPERFLSLNTSPPLLLAGDAFGDLTHLLEGAAGSGLAAAKALLHMHNHTLSPNEEIFEQS